MHKKMDTWLSIPGIRVVGKNSNWLYSLHITQCKIWLRSLLQSNWIIYQFLAPHTSQYKANAYYYRAPLGLEIKLGFVWACKFSLSWDSYWTREITQCAEICAFTGSQASEWHKLTISICACTHFFGCAVFKMNHLLRRPSHVDQRWAAH